MFFLSEISHERSNTVPTHYIHMFVRPKQCDYYEWGQYKVSMGIIFLLSLNDIQEALILEN